MEVRNICHIFELYDAVTSSRLYLDIDASYSFDEGRRVTKANGLVAYWLILSEA